MREDFSEAKVFRDAKSCPFAQPKIDRDGEEHYPRVGDDEFDKHVVTDDRVTDKRDTQGFEREYDGGFVSFFNLSGDEFLDQRDHNQEWENRDRSKSCTAEGAADNEHSECAQGHNSECQGDARQVEQSESSQHDAREHAGDNDSEKNRYAVFDSLRVECEEGKSDDRGRVDTKGFNPDDLTKERYQRGHDRESKKQNDGIERDALLKEEINEWVHGHTNI